MAHLPEEVPEDSLYRNPCFVELEELQRSYVHDYVGIDSYFVKAKHDLETDMKEDGDVLYVRGTENRQGGLMNKCLKSYEYFLQKDSSWNFLLKTTCASFKILPIIYILCEGLKKDKTHVCFGQLNYTNENDLYIRGDCILFSRSVVEMIVEEGKNPDIGYLDDVFYGKVCKKRGVEIGNAQGGIIEAGDHHEWEIPPDEIRNIIGPQFYSLKTSFRDRTVEPDIHRGMISQYIHGYPWTEHNTFFLTESTLDKVYRVSYNPFQIQNYDVFRFIYRPVFSESNPGFVNLEKMIVEKKLKRLSELVQKYLPNIQYKIIRISFGRADILYSSG